MKFVAETSPVPRLLLFSFLPFLVGALILARLVPDSLLAVAHCPLRDTTGVPCPTCGGTLAATRLAAGHWRAAVAANPLVTALAGAYLPLALHATATTLIPRWRRSVQLTARDKKAARWLAAVILALNWIYLGWRYLG